MKKLNKIMLLSITAFVPLATVVACSKTEQKTETFVLENASTSTKTAASTVVKMKITKTEKDAKMADFVLTVKEKGAATETLVTEAATKLEGESIEFEFKNKLTAGKTYELVKVVYKTQSVNTPKFEVVVDAAAAGAAAETGTGAAAGAAASSN